MSTRNAVAERRAESGKSSERRPPPASARRPPASKRREQHMAFTRARSKMDEEDQARAGVVVVSARGNRLATRPKRAPKQNYGRKCVNRREKNNREWKKQNA